MFCATCYAYTISLFAILPTSLHDLIYCFYNQNVIHVGGHVGSM